MIRFIYIAASFRPGLARKELFAYGCATQYNTCESGQQRKNPWSLEKSDLRFVEAGRTDRVFTSFCHKQTLGTYHRTNRLEIFEIERQTR
jgi:hypothetical protein